MRTGFLWSVLGLSVQPQQHLVIQIPPTLTLPPRVLLEQAFPQESRNNLICFRNEFTLDATTTMVPMRSIFQSRWQSKTMPPPRQTRSNYLLYERSRYSSIMDYWDFCAMENKLVQIVLAYLGDEKNHWTLMLEDPFYLNLRSYHVSPSIRDRTTWVSYEKNVYQDAVLLDVDKNEHPFL